MASTPNLPPGTIPDEPEYTEEQLTQLRAAMMEELGIGRLDSLHLADKGPPIESLQPLEQPTKKMRTEIAAWHTLHLEEGADPTTAELDSIADGQLYRLRRGSASAGYRGNGSPRGGHFPNRNRGASSGYRGNDTPRGYHSSNANRGGGKGNRGGAGGRGGHGVRLVPGAQHDRSFPSRTPGTFFNDARLSIHGSRHIDQVYDRLRGTISSVNLPIQHHAGHGPPNPSPEKRQPKAKPQAQPSRPSAQPSRSVHLQTSRSQKLADSDTFLNWAKFPGSSNRSSHPAPSKDNLLPSTSVPSTPGVNSSVPCILPPSSLGSQGLSGSRWGPAAQQTLQSSAAPVPQQSLPGSAAPLAQPNPAVTRNNVRIKKDNAIGEVEGLAALRKDNNTDEFYTLKLVSTSRNNILVNEAISYDAVFELDGCIVTYRPVQRTTETPPTWSIRFQLPLHAAKFATHIIQHRLNAGHAAPPVSDMECSSSKHSLGLETSFSSAPETVDTNQNWRTESAHVQSQVPSNNSTSGNHAGFELGNTSDFAAYGQDSTAENSETLITLGNDDNTYSPPTTMDPKVFELLEGLDQSNLTEMLFEKLGGDLEFFNNMSRELIRRGGKPADEVSLDDMISDPVYISTVCDAVELWLSRSEAFSMLQEDYSKALVQHQGPKVMTLALVRRGLTMGPSMTTTEDNVFGPQSVQKKTPMVLSVPELDSEDDIPAQTQKPGETDNLSQITIVKDLPMFPATTGLDPQGNPPTQTQNPVEDDDSSHPNLAKNPRIQYSPDILLGLRDHAVPIEITEQPPRDRGPSSVRNGVTPVKIAAAVTTTDGWQAFSCLHSKSGAPAPITTPAAPAEVVEPKVEVTSDLKPSISHASVATFALGQGVSSQKDQQTDGAGRATLLGSIGTSKHGIKSGPQIGKDWSLGDKYEAADPITPVLESYATAPQTDVKLEHSPASSVISRNEKPRPTATPAAFTPAGQAMKDKITAALISKQSLVASPFQSPRSSFSRQSVVGSSFESSKTELEAPIQAKQEQDSSSPITVKAETDSNPSQTYHNSTTSAVILAENLKLSSDSQKLPPKPFVQDDRSIESGRPLPAVAQSPSTAMKVLSEPPVENNRGFEFRGPPPSLLQQAKLNSASDENVNKVLQGSAGLSGSRWADAPAAPSFSQARHPATPPLTFQSTYQAGSFYPQGPPRPRVATPGFAPRVGTVLVENPDGTFSEHTGFVKAGSVSIPLVAHDPLPHTGDQAYAELARPSSGGYMRSTNYAAEFDFPQRPTDYHHRTSSFGSDNKINPAAPTFKPSPQRPQMSAPAEQRSVLSPRRVNIQAQIQSRLNSSMTHPRTAYQGPGL